MMCEVPLTPEEQIFAAENHNLVYKFLDEKRLPFDDYYDVIVFGYIKSVHRFFTTPGLTIYAFTNIAWKGMQNALYNYNRSKACQKRTSEIFSLHSTTQAGSLPLEDTLPATDHLMQQLEYSLLLHDLAKRISKQQMEIVRMRSSGYNLQDIAAHQNISTKRIRKLLDEVRCILTELCQE